MQSTYQVNPHAVADWAILTGRLPVHGRARWLRAWNANPVTALADVLQAAPTRTERVCPLFAASDEGRSVAAQEANNRKHQRIDDAEIAAQQAIVSVLEHTRGDITDAHARRLADIELRRAKSAVSRLRNRNERREYHRQEQIQRKYFDALAKRYGDDTPMTAEQRARVAARRETHRATEQALQAAEADDAQVAAMDAVVDSAREAQRAELAALEAW